MKLDCLKNNSERQSISGRSKPQLKTQNLLILAVLFCLPFYFIKLKYDWLSLNLVEILIIALFLIWSLNKEKKYSIHNTQYIIPVIFIITGLLLSIFINKNYYVGFGILKGWFILPIIFAIIYYDNLKKNKELLGWSLAAFFFSGMLVSISGIYYWFSGLQTYDGRLAIFYDSPNQLAMYLAPVFLIGVYKVRPWGILRCYIGEEKGRTLGNGFWKTGLAIAGIFLVALNLYLTKSYGAWLALVIAIGVIFWLIYREKLRKKYLFIIIIIFIIFIGAAGFSKFESIKNIGDRSSLASREMIWKSSVLMIRDNPIFGIGPGNFQNKYLEYQKYFPPYLEWAVPQPHNIFLAFWLQAGLLGLAGFIWILFLFFRDNKKVYPFTKINKYNNIPIREIKKQTGDSLANKKDFGGGAIHNLRALLFVIMLYFIIHGLMDTTYWRNDMAVMFWVVVVTNLFLSTDTSSAKNNNENSY